MISNCTFREKQERKTYHIHYILHAQFEKIGIIEDWAQRHRYVLTGSCPFEGQPLPDVSEFDILIVMGGPQSSVHLDRFPYLQDEILMISKAIAYHKIVIGFCLGAQLIGEALGAKASRSPEKEVGIFPIELTKEGKSDPIFAGFSDTFEVFHWHNDMPGLPKDAVVLAQSEGCPRQIIRFGKWTYGFQCHLETTIANAKEMIANCGEDLKTGRFIQTAEQILQADFPRINHRLITLLDRMVNSCLSSK